MSEAQRRPINPRDLVEGLGPGLRIIEALDDEDPRLTATFTAHTVSAARMRAEGLPHLQDLTHILRPLL